MGKFLAFFCSLLVTQSLWASGLTLQETKALLTTIRGHFIITNRQLGPRLNALAELREQGPYTIIYVPHAELDFKSYDEEDSESFGAFLMSEEDILAAAQGAEDLSHETYCSTFESAILVDINANPNFADSGFNIRSLFDAPPFKWVNITKQVPSFNILDPKVHSEAFANLCRTALDEKQLKFFGMPRHVAEATEKLTELAHSVWPDRYPASEGARELKQPSVSKAKDKTALNRALRELQELRSLRQENSLLANQEILLQMQLSRLEAAKAKTDLEVTELATKVDSLTESLSAVDELNKCRWHLESKCEHLEEKCKKLAKKNYRLRKIEEDKRAAAIEAAERRDPPSSWLRGFAPVFF